MAFDTFLKHVDELAKKIGVSAPIAFRDADTGKYVSAFSDGTRITGNSVSRCLTVIWGSGHQSIVNVAG